MTIINPSDDLQINEREIVPVKFEYKTFPEEIKSDFSIYCFSPDKRGFSKEYSLRLGFFKEVLGVKKEFQRGSFEREILRGIGFRRVTRDAFIIPGEDRYFKDEKRYLQELENRCVQGIETNEVPGMDFNHYVSNVVLHVHLKNFLKLYDTPPEEE